VFIKFRLHEQATLSNAEIVACQTQSIRRMYLAAENLIVILPADTGNSSDRNLTIRPRSYGHGYESKSDYRFLRMG